MAVFENILVAVDVSKEADVVLHKAQYIANRFNSNISLIHVVEPIIMDTTIDLVPTFNIGIEDSLVEASTKFLDQLISRSGLQNCPFKVLVGSTKHEIHSEAKEKNIDLIVIGTHGRHGVARLLGSTASAVLHGAPCDVLTVKIA